MTSIYSDIIYKNVSAFAKMYIFYRVEDYHMSDIEEITNQKKRSKLPLIIIIALVILAACGYFIIKGIRDGKLKEMESSVDQLVKDGEYKFALEVCREAYDSGLDKESVLDEAEYVYSSWLETMTKESDIDIVLGLYKFDEMAAYFPECSDRTEKILAGFSSDFLWNSTDIARMESFYLYINERYSQSDTICCAVDDAIRTRVAELLRIKLKELALEKGLIKAIEDKDFESVFDIYTESAFREDCRIAIRYSEFPIIDTENYGGKMLAVYYLDGAVVLYYGEHDDNDLRSGEGVHLTYMVDKNDPNRYIKQLVYGEFSGDSLNGHFEEMTEEYKQWLSFVHFSGNMVESKYDGKITGPIYNMDESWTRSYTWNYTFEFDNGRPVSQGSYEQDGTVRHIVGNGEMDGKTQTYSYPESYMDQLFGLRPTYWFIW